MQVLRSSHILDDSKGVAKVRFADGLGTSRAWEEGVKDDPKVSYLSK